MGHFLNKTLLAIVAGLAALLLAEGLIRAMGLMPFNDYRRISDPLRPHSLKPLSRMTEMQPEFRQEIRINATGFRDDPFRLQRTPGVLRVAMIGDSFTFGTGVGTEERAGEVLESAFAAKGVDCQVYNFGVPATHTGHHLRILQDHVLDHRPDYAMLCLYLGNDITDLANPAGPAKGMRTLLQRSHLFQLLLARLTDRAWFRDWYNRSKAAAALGEAGRQVQIYRAEPGSPLWTPTMQALERFADLCWAKDIRPMLVLLPAKVQFDEELWTRLNRDGDLQRDLPNTVLRAYARDNLGIAVLDPLEDFRAAQRAGRQLYYPVNGHWTAAAHAVLGEYLAARAM